MTAHAEVHAHDGHHGGEHPPEIHLSSNYPQTILGMLLFIGSEAMLFGAFFAALFFVRVVNEAPHWPPTGYHLPIFVAAMNTIVLVTSSFTMHWSLASIKRNNRVGMIAGLSLTVLMGITFVGTQIREYSRIGFAPGDNAFASTFYGLTGLHGFHVIIGLLLLMFALVRGLRGHYSAEHHHGLEIPGIYWHFVDVMWIIVFITVYII